MYKSYFLISVVFLWQSTLIAIAATALTPNMIGKVAITLFKINDDTPKPTQLNNNNIIVKIFMNFNLLSFESLLTVYFLACSFIIASILSIFSLLNSKTSWVSSK